MFHRLALPTYFGGLPPGYDYLNNPQDPTVGGSGVPALVDSVKSGGPNDGSYFITFGEDATSRHANRPLAALGENTDYLDDLFHRDLAVTVRTTDVEAESPVGSIVLAGHVFVGESGASNSQAQRDRLISVLDDNDNEIVLEDGTKVVASLIHDGSNNNVVGQEASGFFDTPTVTLNANIPVGVVYRVYYGERSNLAELPQDAFTDIKIRGAQEVDASVQHLLRTLHASTGQEWNGPWDATIEELKGWSDALFERLDEFGLTDNTGTLTSTQARQQVNLLSRRTKTDTIFVTGAQTVSLNTVVDGSFHVVTVGTQHVALTYTLAGSGPSDGDEIVILLLGTTLADNLTVTWPSDFRFSGNDADVPSGQGPYYVKFHGIWYGDRYYMTRTDY